MLKNSIVLICKKLILCCDFVQESDCENLIFVIFIQMWMYKNNWCIEYNFYTKYIYEKWMIIYLNIINICETFFHPYGDGIGQTKRAIVVMTCSLQTPRNLLLSLYIIYTFPIRKFKSKRQNAGWISRFKIRPLNVRLLNFRFTAIRITLSFSDVRIWAFIMWFQYYF